MANVQEIRGVFEKSQVNISTHLKLIQQLKKIYKHLPIKDVILELDVCISHAFRRDYRYNKDKQKRTLSFLANFLVDILLKDPDSEEDDPLLVAIINQVLKHTLHFNVNSRYHATWLLEIFLKSICTDFNVSTVLCDKMQYHLIERFRSDPILAIRELSGSALAKLQDIENPMCPVIQTYVLMCDDRNPVIRKLALTYVALTPVAQEIIICLMRDMTVSVRLQAFKKVASMNVSHLTIQQRREVILTATEEKEAPIKTFFSVLFPKWLQTYDNNLLSLYSGLCLDASHEDIQDTRHIYDEIMKIYFKCFSPTQVLQYLPLNGNTVPLEKLDLQVSAYWYYFVMNLQKTEDSDIEMNSVLPELKYLCDYVKSVIKFKEGKIQEQWQKLQFQEILYYLIRLISISDFADEVGRKHLEVFLRETVINVKLEKDVLEQIILIYKQFFTDTDEQSKEICNILSDIQDVLYETREYVEELTQAEKTKLERLRGQVYMLTAEMQVAVEDKQFLDAERLNTNLEEVKQQIEEMERRQAIVEKEPVVDEQLKVETMGRCLDILSVFLKNIDTLQLSPSLAVFIDEFMGFTELTLKSKNMNMSSKFFEVLGQFCILDKGMASQHIQLLCTPLITTKFGKVIKSGVISSLYTVSDLVTIHGPNLLGEEDNDSISNSSVSSFGRSRKRKLYQEMPPQDLLTHCMEITRGLIVDIMLDLLDYEDADVAHAAAISMMRLVLNGLLLNASVLTRLMLKWINPLIEKDDPEMQQIISCGLATYIMNFNSSGSIIQKAIVPTLNSIGNAPDNSPFRDVELDNVLFSLCNLINSQRDSSIIYKNVITDIFHALRNYPNRKSTFALTKMLFVLMPPRENDEEIISKYLEEIDDLAALLGNPKASKLLLRCKRKIKKPQQNGENNQIADRQETTVETMAMVHEPLSVDEHDWVSTTNKENETPVKEHSCSSTTSEIVSDSFSASNVSTPSSKKSVKKRKKDPVLQVIIERSSEVERLTADSSSSIQSPTPGNRKRSYTKKTQQKILPSENTSVDSQVRSSRLTRSSRRQRDSSPLTSTSSDMSTSATKERSNLKNKNQKQKRKKPKKV